MQHSEAIGDLTKALAVAQGLIKAPKKSKTAKITGEKGYSYNYADLADVIECYREPLSKNGLAITQTMTHPNGHIVLTTRLLHESGQWIASEYPIAAYARPQEQGSAITYARRYAVTALLGIAAEDDDDGKAAQDGERLAAPPPSGDASKILDLAAAIQQIDGRDIDEIIKTASFFLSKKDGKPYSFTDPTKVGSVKVLKITRQKLEAELHKLRGSEPGTEEAAKLFT